MSASAGSSGADGQRSTPPPPVLVRRADGDDLVAVIDVGHRTWPPTYGPIAGDDYVAMGLAKWWTQEATIPAIRAGRVTVAEVEGEVVGMSTVGNNGERLWMWKLYVLPDCQGTGVGGALMRAAIHRGADAGHEALWLSYLKGNEHAASFYARHGFEVVEIEEGSSGLPDSVIARRTLTEGDVPSQPAAAESPAPKDTPDAGGEQ